MFLLCLVEVYRNLLPSPAFPLQPPKNWFLSVSALSIFESHCLVQTIYQTTKQLGIQPNLTAVVALLLMKWYLSLLHLLWLLWLHSTVQLPMILLSFFPVVASSICFVGYPLYPVAPIVALTAASTVWPLVLLLLLIHWTSDSSLEFSASHAPSPGTVLSQALQTFDFDSDLDFPTESTVVLATADPSPIISTAPVPVPIPATTKPKFAKVVGCYIWIGGTPLAGWSNTSSIAPLTPSLLLDEWQSNLPDGSVWEMDGWTRCQVQAGQPWLPLLFFATDTLNHMEVHGMDTYFYMEGVSLSGTAQDLFRYHALYTKSHMDAFVQECLGTGSPTAAKIGSGPVDQHRIECLHDSGVWLLNSLDKPSKVNLHSLLPTHSTSPQVWMAIVNKVQMESMILVQELTHQFENMTMV